VTVDDTATPRHCNACGVSETDLSAVFVAVWNSDEIAHVVRDGTLRCGVLVADEVTP
jgi:hypothetical protein